MSAVPGLTAGALATVSASLTAGGFLIAGSGSIGRRHLDNLRQLGVEQATFYRTGLRDPLAPAPLAPEEFDLASALARRPRAVLVCNPNAQHLPTTLAALRSGASVFVEKPLADRREGPEELLREAARRRCPVLVGFQYRFHPGLLQLKSWLDEGAIGEVVSGSAHWGEHLPSWHPGEDWRASYAARAALGGGVVRTLCHPFDYLRWLLGEAEWVSAETASVALGLDVEDEALVTIRFAAGALVSVALDYLRWPRDHRLELVGTRGRLLWSDEDGVARLVRAGSGAVLTRQPEAGFTRNSMFLAEMRHFLDCLEGHALPACTLEDGVAALEVAMAALESARSGRRVRARRRS